MKNTRDFHNTNMKKLAPLGQFLPVTATSSSTTRTTLAYSSCSNLLGLDNMNDPAAEQPSSRWNPTAEQLLALEEMYRRGIRTPSADQIQQIASQLRRFGKIEGKNVFYWFQNHKARERQKRRREADFTSAATTLKLHAGFLEEDYSHSGSFQPQQKKTISVSSNCTEYLEGTFPLRKAESTVTNSSHNGWPQKKNYTWHNVNNTTATSSSTSLNVEETRMMIKPRRNNDLEPEEVEVETLELFPVHKSSYSEDNNIQIGTGRRKKLRRPFNTNQYFEFLKENRN